MTNGPGLRTHAARGGAITLLSQMLRIVIQLVGQVLIARLVGPSAFGLFAMVVAVTGFAELFRDFGLSFAALRRPDLSTQQRSNLFWLNSGFGLLLALVVFGLAHPIATFYGRPELVELTQWIALMCLFNGIAAQFRIMLGQQLRFGVLAIIDVASILVAFVSAAIVAASGYAIPALIVMQIGAPVLALPAMVVAARWLPQRPRRAPEMMSLVTFGINHSLAQMLEYVTENIDNVAIGKLFGTAPLGLYSRAYQYAVGPLNQINGPLSRVAVPILSRVRDDKERFARALKDAQIVACYGTGAGLLVAAGVGTPLVVVTLGPEWAAAGPIFSVLAIGSVFRSIQLITSWIFITQGFAGQRLLLYAVGQPVVIAFLLTGLVWGPIGVAAGGAVGWALFWIGSVVWVRRVTRIDVRPLVLNSIRVVGLIGLPAGALAYAVSWLPIAAGWQLGVGVAAATFWLSLTVLIIPSARSDARTVLRLFASLSGRNRSPTQ